MKPLPRNLLSLVDSPPVEASVHRTWARLQRTRQRQRSPRRLVILSVSLAAAVLGFLVSQPMAKPAVLSEPVAEPVAEPVPVPLIVGAADVPARPTRPMVAAPAPLASAMLQGRARRVAHRVSGDEAPADAVGHLLEGSVEAFADGDATQAATLLTKATAEFPEDARVPEALVTLGWLQLVHLDAPADARKSLELAMEAQLSQELFDRAWPLLQQAQARAPAAP
jgi:hypothetical protein